MRLTKKIYLYGPLLLVCAMSALIGYHIETIPDEAVTYPPVQKVVISALPGIIFISYIIYKNRNKSKKEESIALFLIALACYGGSLVLSLASAGILAPFCGGIGATIVYMMFYARRDSSPNPGMKSFFYHGFNASLVGIILFYCYPDIGPGSIIGLWQFVIGIKCLEYQLNEETGSTV